jgi:lysophospholipase L1-like esterase
MRSVFERYVAIGDSTTEGLDDPDGAGGYRGWANRLAERIAGAQGSLLYANLAVRGKTARKIKDEQLAAATALRPDLATVVAGMNDLLSLNFDARQIAADVGEMQRALVGGGAVVVTFTLPDVSRRMRIGGALSARTAALNDALAEVSTRTGARLVDLTAFAVSADPRIWSRDRLHLNAEGHARTADALATELGVPGIADWWRHPLPPSSTSCGAQLAEDVSWVYRHVAPWLVRKLRGRSAGDACSAKRPVLAPV